MHSRMFVAKEKHYKDYVNCVFNPFAINGTAKIPDKFSGRSICARDYRYIPEGLTNQSGGAARALLVWFYPLMVDNTGSPYLKGDRRYGLAYVWIAADGTPAGTVTEVGSFATTNYETITGHADSWGLAVSYLQSLRVVSAGIRIKPTIAYPDASGTAPTNLRAGYLNYGVLRDFLVSGIYTDLDFIGMIRGTTSIEVNPAFGVSSYYCPSGNDANAWNGVNATQCSDGTRLPFILATFGSGDIANTAVSPLQFECMIHLECQFQKPTPWITQLSPIGNTMNTTVAALNTMPEQYVGTYTNRYNTQGWQIFKKAYTTLERGFIPLRPTKPRRKVKKKKVTKKRKKKKQRRKRYSRAMKKSIENTVRRTMQNGFQPSRYSREERKEDNAVIVDLP